MLDLLGWIGLPALAVGCVAFLSSDVPVKGGARKAGMWTFLTWLAVVTLLAASGIFHAIGVGTPALGIAVAAPLIVGVFAYARSEVLRSYLTRIPLQHIVALHAGRILGVMFFALYYAGRLPATFALSAGWGDLVVGAMAIPISWMVARRSTGWRGVTLVWNTLGLVDLITAVTLGVGSSAGSPLRFIYENPSSGAISLLPWAL